MISETTFAKKFTSFWSQLLPNANNYIRLVNGAMVKSLYSPEIPVRSENVALCNIIAFEVFARVKTGQLHEGDLRSGALLHKGDFKDIGRECVQRLKVFSHGSSMKLPITRQEAKDIQSIAVHMVDYFPPGTKNIEFAPEFDGLGYLNSAQGDLLYEDVLVEVKAGYRKFSVNDLRQVLVYLALNHYSRESHLINKIELYNPRMGSVFEADVAQLCDEISALQPSDLFHEVLLFVTENDFVELPDT